MLCLKRAPPLILCIVFNASSKPNDGKSLNDCLLTGPSSTAKLHEILVQFCQGTYAITADIIKAFHRIIVNPDDRKFLKFLWQNLETDELLTYQFKVVFVWSYMLTISVAGNFTHPFVPKRGG